MLEYGIESPVHSYVGGIMSERADSKKQHIIKAAREVFALKGFKDVTMKDIVEKAQISRGGLYLYYDSTEAVFRDVLAMEGELEDENDNDGLVTSISDASAGDILMCFLRQQKKEMNTTRTTTCAFLTGHIRTSMRRLHLKCSLLQLQEISSGTKRCRNGSFPPSTPSSGT